MTVTRITQLSEEETARFDEWADKWIEIGLRTGPANRELFEASVRDCYRFAGIPFPEVVVWVPSPLVLSFAAPTAAFTLELIEAIQRRQPLGFRSTRGRRRRRSELTGTPSRRSSLMSARCDSGGWIVLRRNHGRTGGRATRRGAPS